MNFLGDDFINLIQKIFIYDPEKRIKPIQALCHCFFDYLRKEGIIEEKFRNLIFTFSKEEINCDKENIIFNYLIPDWFNHKI